jgi:cation diffusion facilitator family transporter
VSKAVTTAAGSVAVAIAVLALKLVAAWMTAASRCSPMRWKAWSTSPPPGRARRRALRRHAGRCQPPLRPPQGEYFSAVLEGALILVAAFVILDQAWAAWSDPRPPALTLAAGLIALVASGINALWCAHLFRRGRALRSPALLADARHLLSDVVTSAGVLAGVLLASLTGHVWLDPLLAALTAVNILFSGFRLMRESVGGLMDEALSPQLLSRIRATVAKEAEGALEAHDIRSRQAGRSTFIEFHLVVPGGMTVNEAHAICDRVEAALRSELGDAVITIHVEPGGQGEASRGGGAVIATGRRPPPVALRGGFRWTTPASLLLHGAALAGPAAVEPPGAGARG